jgi:hypothetical protein
VDEVVEMSQVISFRRAAERKGLKMATVIGICDQNGKVHPAWDVRHTPGDRDVPFVLTGVVGRLNRECPAGFPLYRPYQLTAFLDAMCQRHPSGITRWTEMTTILRDPQWWLRITN